MTLLLLWPTTERKPVIEEDLMVFNTPVVLPEMLLDKPEQIVLAEWLGSNPMRVLLDSSATLSLVSESWATRSNIQTRTRKQPIAIQMIDGYSIAGGITKVTPDAQRAFLGWEDPKRLMSFQCRHGMLSWVSIGCSELGL